MTVDEVRELMTQPERVDLEFKQRVTRDVARTIVAMANGRGGMILVGISDSAPRQIVGVDAPFDQIEGEILNALRDRVNPPMHPLPTFETVTVDDKTVLVIHVPESQIKGLTINGHRLIRRGSHTERATREEERRMFQESHEVSYEQSLVLGAEYAHLNPAKIEDFLLARVPRALETDTRSPQEWLAALGLVRPGDYAPTVAALVLFGEYPPRFLPQVAINAVHIRGRDLSSNIFLDRRMLEGTATELIEQAFRFVLDNMKVGGWIDGMFREDIHEYPPEAVREAIVNAVIHRDYSQSTPILVRMFDDRLEITNAGGLPSGVTIQQLLDNPHPYPRNPLIVRTLYDWWRGKGVVEQLGSGIPRIRRALRQLGSGEPLFEAESLWFRVTMPARKFDEPNSEE
jgi:ATP-dependent DNA helicase RecG